MTCTRLVISLSKAYFGAQIEKLERDLKAAQSETEKVAAAAVKPEAQQEQQAKKPEGEADLDKRNEQEREALLSRVQEYLEQEERMRREKEESSEREEQWKRQLEALRSQYDAERAEKERVQKQLRDLEAAKLEGIPLVLSFIFLLLMNSNVFILSEVEVIRKKSEDAGREMDILRKRTVTLSILETEKDLISREKEALVKEVRDSKTDEERILAIC